MALSTSDAQKFLAAVAAAVEHLGAPAPEQVELLRSLKTFPSADELALELEDVLPLVSQLQAEGRLSRESAEQLQSLDEKLAEMSGTPALWDAELLATDPDWADVRARARLALQSIATHA